MPRQTINKPSTFNLQPLTLFILENVRTNVLSSDFTPLFGLLSDLIHYLPWIMCVFMMCKKTEGESISMLS